MGAHLPSGGRDGRAWLDTVTLTLGVALLVMTFQPGGPGARDHLLITLVGLTFCALVALVLCWLPGAVPTAATRDESIIPVPARRTRRRVSIAVPTSVMLAPVLVLFEAARNQPVTVAQAVVSCALSALALARARTAPWSAAASSTYRAGTDPHTGVATDPGVQEEVRRLTYDDALTGIANRLQLRQRLDAVLGADPVSALLMLDLDDFKLVNDLYGHTFGDQMLIEAARRLTIVADQFEGACLARLGGDEFALLLPDVNHQEARWVSASLINRLRQPVHIGPARLELGVSIGLVMLDDDGGDVDAALRNGDLALHAAKADGKNQWTQFEPSMHARLVQRVTLEAELATAVDTGQLELHYQPLVTLASGQVAGAEALLRWRHPERGLLPPGEFLTAAEQASLIHSIGTWVLTAACRQLMHWTGTNSAAVPEVAVNVSPLQLMDPCFADLVADILTETGLDPDRLTLEITESVALDLGLVHDQLRALEQLGVGLAIDDFGTGFSSMSRLADLPVDSVKIDRSFVQAIPEDGEAPLVRAMISMAHSLGLTVVAEGIETDIQREYLTHLGCDQGQGYLFARPMPAEALAALPTTPLPWGSAAPAIPRQAPPTSPHAPTGTR